MSVKNIYQSPLEIYPPFASSSQTEMDVKFSAANQAFGNPTEGTKKADVTFLIRFSDYSYFGPITVFPAVEIGATEAKTVRIPIKDVEQTFVFWKEILGTSITNRAASVSTNDRTMSSRPSDIQIGWGVMGLQGTMYEQAIASMYRF